jgi:hypothetical protein
MIRIASMTAALCLVSGFAMAEPAKSASDLSKPVKLTAAQLDETAAGRWSSFRYFSYQNNSKTVTNTVNQSATAVAIGGMFGSTTATASNNNVVVVK